MRITLNGADKETNVMTVEGLVAELGLKRGTVLVEQNGTALRPDEWAQAAVNDSDRVEILRIVAGG
jgi:sulfur carrier protein